MNGSDFTILIAEDDTRLLDIYEKSLSAEGYKLILVKTCERVLAELFEKEADLLITDMKMADMEGLEMFPLLMKNHPNLPVIVVSGTFEGTIEGFHQRGFPNVRAFFMKPVGMDILKRKIQEVLMVSV